MIVTVAPAPTITSDRRAVAVALWPVITERMTSGSATLTPAAMPITAPSLMKAAFSASAGSPLAIANVPSCASAAIAALQCGRQRRHRHTLRQLAGRNVMAIDEQDLNPGEGDVAARAAAIAESDGRDASGAASRSSARQSVYFHDSTRRCGRPPSAIGAKAAVRAAMSPGKWARALSKARTSACSRRCGWG